MASWFDQLTGLRRKKEEKPQKRTQHEMSAMNTESACIWLSGASSWPDNIKLWFDPKKEDKKNSYALDPAIYDAMDRAGRGERLEPDEIPDWFYEPKNMKPFMQPNHAHLISGGFHFISPQVKDVFDRFDMGNNLIKPVALLKSDKKTVAHEGYCVLNIADKKRAFLPEHTPNARKASKNSTRDLWIPPLDTDEDKTMAFSPAALEGADLWLDERVVKRCWFFSDRLIRALEAEGLVSENWKLLRCPIVDE